MRASIQASNPILILALTQVSILLSNPTFSQVLILISMLFLNPTLKLISNQIYYHVSVPASIRSLILTLILVWGPSLALGLTLIRLVTTQTIKIEMGIEHG